MSKLKAAHISIDEVDNGFMLMFWTHKESKKGKLKDQNIRLYYECLDDLISELQGELHRMRSLDE